MWVDEQDREYTPEYSGMSSHWWVRIPHSVTLRVRRDVASGKLAPTDTPGFPEPTETLVLHRFYAGVDDRRVTVRVEALIAPKQASAEIHFEQEVDAMWSDRERAFMERKTETQARKRAQP